MRDSVGDPEGMERIWRSSILPLLVEHHIGDDVNVPATYGLPALRAATSPAPSTSSDEAPIDADPQA